MIISHHTLTNTMWLIRKMLHIEVFLSDLGSTQALYQHKWGITFWSQSQPEINLKQQLDNLVLRTKIQLRTSLGLVIGNVKLKSLLFLTFYTFFSWLLELRLKLNHHQLKLSLTIWNAQAWFWIEGCDTETVHTILEYSLD